MSKTKQRAPGFVYLATGSRGYKIGSTSNLKRRAYGLKKQFGDDTEIVWSMHITPDRVAVELGLHAKFSAQRKEGEWFDLTDDDVTWVTRMTADDAAAVAGLWKPTRSPTGTRLRPKPVAASPTKTVGRTDMTGERYGRLVAISYAGTNPKNSHGGAMWLCRCDCGNEHTACRQSLRQGRVKSCGCIMMESRHRTHGKTKTPEYGIWLSMRQRCGDEKHVRYDRYGGRGIRVCPQWHASFETFLADMGVRPSADHSIERKDNNGDYEPGNCVWATQAEQIDNRECTTRVTFNGETRTLRDWSVRLGICRLTLRSRLFTYGWSTERSFTTPVRPRGRKKPAEPEGSAG